MHARRRSTDGVIISTVSLSAPKCQKDDGEKKAGNNQKLRQVKGVTSGTIK
jgi:hypothetical protein